MRRIDLLRIAVAWSTASSTFASSTPCYLAASWDAASQWHADTQGRGKNSGAHQYAGRVCYMATGPVGWQLGSLVPSEVAHVANTWSVKHRDWVLAWARSGAQIRGVQW